MVFLDGLTRRHDGRNRIVAMAEDVARSRLVSLDTVRSQIRTILGKTGASGPRDFERIIALSSTMHVSAASRPQTGNGVQRMPGGS